MTVPIITSIVVPISVYIQPAAVARSKHSLFGMLFFPFFSSSIASYATFKLTGGGGGGAKTKRLVCPAYLIIILNHTTEAISVPDKILTETSLGDDCCH